MRHNLMEDPLLRVDRGDGGRVGCSLPEVMAGLTRQEIVAFAALQPFQVHAWHAFLVQLAAIALHQAGEEILPDTANAWRQILRALTPDWPNDAPWHLLVEDLSQPAFMQPPVPEGSLAPLKNRFAQSDAIDVLVTAKDHDIKMARVGDPRPEHWIFALVNLQTMEGFSGRDNYGIARMNGGLASRPGVGIRPGGADAAAHFRRDVAFLRHYRPELLSRHSGYPEAGGVGLTWTLPWDGGSSLALHDLDPYFIEVCRRVRLAEDSGQLVAHTSTSKGPR
ncbi:MAG: type I-E CRISPR-associated protein Cse1/CasA, partial [Magnetococcales bacterium]|nr:type I-E CRISPR-associated protein Cse1/CasA [Magnetococcales bacterium]